MLHLWLLTGALGAKEEAPADGRFGGMIVLPNRRTKRARPKEDDRRSLRRIIERAFENATTPEAVELVEAVKPAIIQKRPVEAIRIDWQALDSRIDEIRSLVRAYKQAKEEEDDDEVVFLLAA